MAFDLQKNRSEEKSKQDHDVEGFFGHGGEEKKQELLEEQDHLMLSEHSEDVILHWQGPEHENYPKDRRWYLVAALFLSAIIAYAIFTNSPIMAITFILIGVVGYIFLNKMPRVLDFAVTYDGIVVGHEIYDYDDIVSFWIFYEEPHQRIISLHLKEKFVPFVHIPLHQLDPVKVRAAMMQFIPEVKQRPTIVDTLERLLHI